MALEMLAVLTALGMLSHQKERRSPGVKGPTFPPDNTAVTFPAPGNVIVPVPATVPASTSSPSSPAAPSPGPTTPAVSVQPAAPTKPIPAGKGVTPGSPEPGWQPYLPPPAAVVARARQVLSSGQIRVTEPDPTGRFAKVRYRRERNPSTGSISVTAWRPAGAVANA